MAAVFVQSAAEATKRDEEIIVKAQLGQKAAHERLLRKLYMRIGVNSIGRISLQEMCAIWKDELVQAYFSSLELEPDSAWTFFKLLDSDGGCALDMEEFVDGCMTLRGPTREVHIMSMTYLAAFSILLKANCDSGELEVSLEMLGTCLRSVCWPTKSSSATCWRG